MMYYRIYRALPALLILAIMIIIAQAHGAHAVQSNYTLLSFTLAPYECNSMPLNCTTDLRIILIPYYANPFNVSLAGMPSLSSLPINYPSQGIRWTLIWLPDPARAGNGSRTYILVSRGTEDKLLIFLEPGGACTDYYTCWYPVPGVSTVLTMNATYPNIWIDLFAYTGILNRSNPLNPFRNWTYVFIPYDTGDVFSGDRVMEYCGIGINGMMDCVTTYHVGFVDAIMAMRWAAAQGPWKQVVLAGSSAGGVGTILLSYYTVQIFNDSHLIVIDDSGPGLTSTVNPHFTFETTEQSWGYLELMTPEAREIVEETGEPLLGLEYEFQTIGKNVTFALYEMQEDLVMGTLFLGYTPNEYQQVLLYYTGKLRQFAPNNFFRYLPIGYAHMILVYPVLLPPNAFYTFSICGLPVYEWVDLLLEGKPIDIVQVTPYTCVINSTQIVSNISLG
ncbi:pectin acetylesterase-family hydrolase [Vulcanisaeta souniana]|nr:pectin acetylesterase-family hydrolase [Vulcanisaeta souniana]